MTIENEEEIRHKMAQLRIEHGDLDLAITALEEKSAANILPIQRLKKKKLAIKDQIQRLENMLFPDIIA
ncbi:MAG: DUF465 domain-containing protein [Cohaesibacter sp.]|nr:DUF465 domain-containing protein [Cohaesibacter sp.]MCV6602931.1 DUF465 domain-containing protein [Cohaesibacter sp.]